MKTKSFATVMPKKRYQSVLGCTEIFNNQSFTVELSCGHTRNVGTKPTPTTHYLCCDYRAPKQKPGRKPTHTTVAGFKVRAAAGEWLTKEAEARGVSVYALCACLIEQAAGCR